MHCKRAFWGHFDPDYSPHFGVQPLMQKKKTKHLQPNSWYGWARQTHLPDFARPLKALAPFRAVRCFFLLEQKFNKKSQRWDLATWKTLTLMITWQPLGKTLLKVKLLVGYIRKIPLKATQRSCSGIRLSPKMCQDKIFEQTSTKFLVGGWTNTFEKVTWTHHPRKVTAFHRPCCTWTSLCRCLSLGSWRIHLASSS